MTAVWAPHALAPLTTVTLKNRHIRLESDILEMYRRAVWADQSVTALQEKIGAAESELMSFREAFATGKIAHLLEARARVATAESAADPMAQILKRASLPALAGMRMP